ncbi:MAG: methyl-accepting chemotaxis protein [Desulfurivibrio sp.]|nr:methyl-accepting chemotaxis protein [Desulfurivibrio sp.]
MLKKFNEIVDALIGNLTVKQQISAGFILMIGLLLLSGVASYIGVNFVIRDAKEMAASNQLDAELAQREVDHLLWANQLAKLFTDDSVTSVTVETDDHNCGLGKWLYGDGRQQAEELLPSLAPYLRQLEGPHQRLHQSAIRINEIASKARDSKGDVLMGMEQSQRALQNARRVYSEETLPTLEEVQDIMHRARDHVSANLVNDEGLLATAWGLKWRVALVVLGGAALGMAITWPLTIRLSRILERAAREVGNSSEQVASAAHEISSSSQSLSDTASNQASNVEETSAALEEISSQSAHTVELTEGSEKLMQENIRKSGQSLKALAELTQSMTQIEKDSDQISHIISTIDSIAFQTNLLALNAAVEAARAGEAGAGFAVVADEVKNLASKTAKEANQIQQLLDTTVTRITSCASSLKEINSDFDDIVETATVIGDKNSSITEATNQQSKGVQQITEATNENSDATQQIAAAAEQAAAASEELSAQSDELKTVVTELEKLVFGGSQAGRAGNGKAPGNSTVSRMTTTTVTTTSGGWTTTATE